MFALLFYFILIDEQNEDQKTQPSIVQIKNSQQISSDDQMMKKIKYQEQQIAEMQKENRYLQSIEQHWKQRFDKADDEHATLYSRLKEKQYKSYKELVTDYKKNLSLENEKAALLPSNINSEEFNRMKAERDKLNKLLAAEKEQVAKLKQIQTDREQLTKLLTAEKAKNAKINAELDVNVKEKIQIENLLKTLTKKYQQIMDQKNALTEQIVHLNIEVDQIEMEYQLNDCKLKKTIEELQAKNIKLMDELAICKPIYTQIELPD